MSMKNFRVEDMPVKVAIAEDSKSESQKKRSQRKAGSQAQQQAAPTSNEPPDGTSTEVKEWVGDDPQRAQAALDKEQANEKPRSTLTEDLQEIVDKAANSGQSDQAETTATTSGEDGDTTTTTTTNVTTNTTTSSNE